MDLADWIRGAAPIGGIFVATLVVGWIIIWVASLFKGDDGFQPIGSESPPPPRSSPFAPPARGEAPHHPAAGEVKP